MPPGRLFRTRGFDATSVRDIAATAGVSVGTVALAGNKAKLFLDSMEENAFAMVGMIAFPHKPIQPPDLLSQRASHRHLRRQKASRQRALRVVTSPSEVPQSGCLVNHEEIAGASSARGFTLDVAMFNTTSAETAYGQRQLDSRLSELDEALPRMWLVEQGDLENERSTGASTAASTVMQ